MAYLFDGTNDALQSLTTINLSWTNRVTASFWLYWDSFADDDDYALEFTADSGAVNGGFGISPNHGSGSLAIHHDGNAGLSQALYTRPSAAAWHHYAATFDMSLATDEVNLFLDGVLQTPGSRPSNNNNALNFTTSTLNVMSRNNTTFFGAGRMAELTLWPGVSLTAPVVQALMRGAHPFHLLHRVKPYYWPLDARFSPAPGLAAPLLGDGQAPPLLRVIGAAPVAPPPMPLPTLRRPILERHLMESLDAIEDTSHRLLLLGVG